MATPGNGDYVALDNVHVWWSERTPTQVHLTATDPDVTHPGTDPGLRVVFSTNPRSANYHPANFNRVRGLLLRFGKSAPPEAAEEGPRKLDQRGS